MKNPALITGRIYWEREGMKSLTAIGLKPISAAYAEGYLAGLSEWSDDVPEGWDFVFEAEDGSRWVFVDAWEAM